MALSGIRMLSVTSGRRMNSLSSFASSSMSTKLKHHTISDTSKFGGRLSTSQPSRCFSSTSLHSLHLTRLQHVGRVNINIHLRPCEYAQFFSTSSKSSVATSSSAAASAAKLQTRQRLKWKIIARVAYYLRVRLVLCLLFMSVDI